MSVWYEDVSGRGPTPPAADQLETTMTVLLRTSLSPGTIKTYERQWDKFQTFVLDVLHKQFVMPASPYILAKYASYLCLAGYSYSTILSTLSVVSFAHKIRGLGDPASSFLIHKILIGIRKKLAKPDSRKPITEVMLKKMLVLIDMAWKGEYTGVMLRAIFTLMFHLGLQVGEVVRSGDTEHTV